MWGLRSPSSRLGLWHSSPGSATMTWEERMEQTVCVPRGCSASPLLCPLNVLHSSLPHAGVRCRPCAPRAAAWIPHILLSAGTLSLAQGIGALRAGQAFLTPGLCSQRTLERFRCTAVILVLALSSWAGSPLLRALLQVWALEGSHAAAAGMVSKGDWTV